MANPDLTPLFRSSVGFDQLAQVLDLAEREAARDQSYPPYNIVRLGADLYRITMAVAGFGDDDLEIVVQNSVLMIRGRIQKPETDLDYLHRGIAQRAFQRQFQLAQNLHVDKAELDKGLLHVHLVREAPANETRRKIAVTQY